jgi:hypothetical protein
MGVSLTTATWDRRIASLGDAVAGVSVPRTRSGLLTGPPSGVQTSGETDRSGRCGVGAKATARNKKSLPEAGFNR